ncbi:MAG: hypothetical protein AAF519_16585 [Bacteroidota bacterium]
MNQHAINLFHIPHASLFSWIKDQFNKYHYDFSKHIIVLENNSNKQIGYVRLPLHISLDERLIIHGKETTAMYLTIESGNAAAMVCRGKLILYHTTFTAYMARKRQGFSQIKYLNKKGKSRAGSRVRLAATTDFFENINHKCSKILETYNIERIALNCSTTLLPYLYQSKVPCPFNRKDPKLYKIPIHVPRSNFSNLEKTFKKLMAPILFFDQKYQTNFCGLVELSKHVTDRTE